MSAEVGVRTRDVQDEYDRLAGDYDSRWAHYIAESTRETVQRLVLAPEDRLLDVGCGTGVLLERVRAEWPTARAVGVDLSFGMLGRARERGIEAVSLVRGDVGALPFSASCFDVVVSNSALHYWPDASAALREVTRVLRPGGRLVITDWCGDFLTCRALGGFLRLTGRAHERSYRSDECVALLEDAGYTVTLQRFKIDWFWGMMTACAVRTSSE